MKISKNKMMLKKHFIIPMLAMVVFMLSSATAYASSDNAVVRVPVKQILTVNQGTIPGGGDVFYYKLTPQQEDNPMPEGSKDGVYSFSMKDTQEGTLQEISYDKIGDYEYRIEQTITEEKQGYGYDRKVYTILVSIRNREESGLYADLILKNEAGEKVDAASFANTYTGKKITGSTGTNGTSPNYTTPSTQNRPLVKTGDETKLLLFAAMFLGSFLVLTIVAGIRKKEKSNA